MSSNFEVNVKLSLFDYLGMVNAIVSEFINEDDGSYQPHIGNLNAMRLFYNYCVKKSDYDKKYEHNITDAESMAEIVADDGFIVEFNKALDFDGKISYNFANAYRTAMDIVDTEKSAINRLAKTVSAAIGEILESTSSLLTEENLSVLSQIGKDISNGKISAEAIVDAYAKNMSKDKEIDKNVVADTRIKESNGE